MEHYYEELGVESSSAPAAGRMAFDETLCQVVEELRPEIVSFHFGLPAAPLVERVRAAGADGHVVGDVGSRGALARGPRL